MNVFFVDSNIGMGRWFRTRRAAEEFFAALPPNTGARLTVETPESAAEMLWAEAAERPGLPHGQRKHYISPGGRRRFIPLPEWEEFSRTAPRGVPFSVDKTLVVTAGPTMDSADVETLAEWLALQQC